MVSVITTLRGMLKVSDSYSSIADRIQTKWSEYQRGELMEDLPNDCRTLKELLQVSKDVQPMSRIT